MEPTVARQTGIVVVENAKRLLEDAKLLQDMDRYPTAYAIAILAQEEFGKAFMLHLIAEQAVVWSEGLDKAFRSHPCKQLVALIMEYLQREDWLEMQKQWDQLYRGVRKLPTYVIDAVHIIVHEYGRDLNRSDWTDEGKRKVDPQATRIANGILDREKQAGLYVSFGSNGMIRRAPHLITEAQSKNEIERTEKVSNALWIHDGKLEAGAMVEMDKLVALFQVISGIMTMEKFTRVWW
jgi:AbiV family abortive infection protein